jgi:transcriptional regulator GlxA family with amidase domain
MRLRTGLILFDDAEELDFVGPWEVFAAARMVKPERFEPVLISETGAKVRCAKGMVVEAQQSFAEVPTLDVILVPGGQGTRREVKNATMLDYIARVAPGCSFVTSVCTGSLLLTAAGPARGKRVTTHWSFIETLRSRGEAAEVVEQVRFVRDGNVVTAAGVSAGIDMALWLIGQLESPAFARQIQHYIEYNPAPPYTAEA